MCVWMPSQLDGHGWIEGEMQNTRMQWYTKNSDQGSNLITVIGYFEYENYIYSKYQGVFDPPPLLLLHVLADGVLVGSLPQVPIGDLSGPPDLQDVSGICWWKSGVCRWQSWSLSLSVMPLNMLLLRWWDNALGFHIGQNVFITCLTLLIRYSMQSNLSLWCFLLGGELGAPICC